MQVANNIVEIRGGFIEGPPMTRAGQRTMTMPASVMADPEVHLIEHAGPVHVFSGPGGGAMRPGVVEQAAWRPAVLRAGLSPLRSTTASTRGSPCWPRPG